MRKHSTLLNTWLVIFFQIWHSKAPTVQKKQTKTNISHTALRWITALPSRTCQTKRSSQGWRSEWLSRPNIAISEMAQTIKQNWPLIEKYSGKVFTRRFVQSLGDVILPLMDSYAGLDNKDNSTHEPPTLLRGSMQRDHCSWQVYRCWQSTASFTTFLTSPRRQSAAPQLRSSKQSSPSKQWWTMCSIQS